MRMVSDARYRIWNEDENISLNGLDDGDQRMERKENRSG